jgi:ABC-2 type transport system permease protein
MRELWLVARQEYLTRVRQRSFLLGVLAIPLLIVVSVGVAILASQGGTDSRPLGYVDQSGVLAAAVTPTPEEGAEPTAVRAFADPEAARAALEAGEIQAYYVLPPDYLQTREVSLHYLDQGPSRSTQDQFGQFIRANLLVGQPIGERSWAQEGPTLTIRSVDATRDWSVSNIANLILPYAMGFFFFFVVMASAGYMLQAVTDEKENRTIEVIVTSMTPLQLIGGKALGLMGVALTQMTIWVAVTVSALLIAGPLVPFLGNLQMPWGLVAVFLLYFLPSFGLVSGIMIAIGGAVADHRQGQQIAGILNMFFVVPMVFSANLVFINPDNAGLVGLTLFPTSAMLTIMLRWGLTIIPLWQLVLSWVLLMVAAGLSVWAAARIFRLGMLRYGQELNLREALAGLRARKNRSEQGEEHA